MRQPHRTRPAATAALPLVLVAVAATAATGCTKKKEDSTRGQAAGESTSKAGAASPVKPIDPAHESAGPAAEAHVGEKPTLGAGDYEKLMLRLSSCELDGIRISAGCRALQQLVDYRRARRLAAEVSALSAKHLGHPSVPVRVHAATMMRSFLVGTEANVGAGLVAASSEKHPAVLANLVRALQPDIKTSDKIAALLLKLADHESPLVRGEVVAALVSRDAAGVVGSFEKALSMTENDPEEEVRERGCRDLGRRVDDRALPLLARLTAPEQAGKSVKVYNACWEALGSMFINVPFFDASSEKGFALLLERLEHKNCSMQTPPFRIFGTLGQIANPKLAAVAPWLEAVRPKLYDALQGVILCTGANAMARTSAIDAMVKGGADKKLLAGLRRTLAARKSDPAAARLIKKLDVALR